MIIFISWLAYLISYLGRNDYSACVLEIVTSTGMTRAHAGMISSAFALSNAIGQLNQYDHHPEGVSAQADHG